MIGWVSIFALWDTRSGHQYYCSVRPSNNLVPFCLLYLYAHVKPVNAAASRASSSRPEITHYSLSGGYAPDSAKAEGSSIVDEPGGF